MLFRSTRAEADTPETRRQRLADADRVLTEGHAFLIPAGVERAVAPATFSGRPELVAAIDAMMRRASPAGVAAALRGMAERRDARDDLRAIAVPTLVVVGAEDVITPPAGAAQLAAAIPGATLTVIPDAGHLAPMEAPAAVNAALRELLSRS